MENLIFFDMALMSCVQNSVLIHLTDLPAAHIIRRRMRECLMDNKSARILNCVHNLISGSTLLYI